MDLDLYEKVQELRPLLERLRVKDQEFMEDMVERFDEDDCYLPSEAQQEWIEDLYETHCQ